LNPHDIAWSGSEKKIARRAFDAALDGAVARIVAEFKAKAATVATDSEMWEMEDYLKRKHREVEELFDYRYSQLCFVFARLIYMGYLDEAQLVGLSAEKLELIRDVRSRLTLHERSRHTDAYR
jgi:hypothetical protein